MKFSISKFVFFVSLFFIFFEDLLAFGKVSLAIPTSILPGFYINDIGLIIPILFFLIEHKKIQSKIVLYIFFWLSLTFLFGFFISLLYSKSFSNQGPDLRIYIAFVSGFTLIFSLKIRLSKIVSSLNLLLTLLNIVILFQFLLLPNINSWVYDRVGSESIYNLIGANVILLPSLYLFTKSYGNKTNLNLTIINVLFLLLSTILFLKTRSIFVVFIITGFFIHLTNKKNNFKSEKKKSKNLIFQILFYGGIFLLLFLISNFESTNLFVSRMQSISNSEDDVNIQFRLLEPVIVFSNANLYQLLFGFGINPPAVLESATGENYNSMHIGILNIVWRFGILVFLIWFSFYLKYLYSWYLAKGPNFKALLICSPSIITYFLVSLNSGGWGIYPFLYLGIVLGIYYKINLLNREFQ